MSQRLHIGKTKDDFYECVLINNQDAETKLIKEWIYYGTCPGPLKIRIGDLRLWRQVKNNIADVIVYKLNKRWPDYVWVFYYKNKKLEHPTLAELEEWVNNA